MAKILMIGWFIVIPVTYVAVLYFFCFACLRIAKCIDKLRVKICSFESSVLQRLDISSAPTEEVSGDA